MKVAQSVGRYLEQTKKKGPTRANVSAAKMAPLVRDMAAREALYRKDSEAVAKSYGASRLAITDCVDVNLDSRLRAVEHRLGMTGGFIARVA